MYEEFAEQVDSTPETSINPVPPDIRALYWAMLASHSRPMPGRKSPDWGARWASLVLVLLALCVIGVGLVRGSTTVRLFAATLAALGLLVGAVGLGYVPHFSQKA